MVNIAEKLKNAKKDTTLWSPLFGPVTLVDAGQMIYVNTNDGRSECFDENGRYFLKNSGCYSVDCLLFPAQGETWKNWKKSEKPQFKVGDWITDGNLTVQITSIGNGWYLYGEYSKDERRKLGDIKDIDKTYHLWSIEDAKVGDVLSNNNVICIFAGLDKDKNIFSPCMYTSQHGLEVFSSGEECLGSRLLRPATQKDCDILFSELDEAGYRWDENKGELVLLVKQRPKHNDKKNKHYDINNFHVGMDVLCRDDNVSEWCYLKFSHYSKTSDIGHFNAGGSHWQQCIPLKGNERLLGKFDECDSFYVNW